MQCVDFGQANACAAIGSAYNGCVRACGQVKHEGRFRRIWWCESIFPDVNRVNIILPVVVGCDESTRRIVYAENRIPNRVRNPEPTERWPQRAKHYRLGLGPSDNKATDQNVVTGGNKSSSREIERLRSHCRKLCIF